MPEESRPPRLPGAAPAALRQFVACTVDRVELDLADMGWIPKPDLPGNLENVVTPSATVVDGWTPSRATIRVGYGDFISIDLPASIVDGELRIDTSNLGMGGVGTEVDKWVDSFNRTLRENDKQLDSLDVRDDKVTLTKKARAAAGASSIAPATSAIPATTPTPSGEPEEKRGWGCFAWLAGAIAAIAIAVGLVANSGDDKTETAIPSPTGAAASTTTSPSTSSSTSTSTTSSTVAEVGQAPPATGPPQVALGGCGTFDGATPQPGAYLDLPDGGACAPNDDAYLPVDCNSAFLACSSGQAPGIILVGRPGTSHQFGATDAITGEDGNSTELWPVLARLFTDAPDQIVRVRSDCGGTLLTGEALLDPAGVTIVEQPLQSFGSCRIDRIEAAAAAHLANNDVDLFDLDAVNKAAAAVRDEVYIVDASEPAPISPVADPFNVMNPSFEVRNDWADSVNTINNTLGTRPVDNGCLWFFEPTNVELITKVLDACQPPGHYWVFAAGLADIEVELTVTDTVLGTTATYANPLGEVAPSVTDTEAFATSDPLFDDSIFPCGYGHVAYTACTADGPPMDAGGFVTVSAVMIDPIPIEGDGTGRTHRIDFVPAGPSYTIAQDREGWSVASSTGDTRARALFRHDSVTFVAPQDELPGGPLGYVWNTTVDDRTVSQPTVPIVGVITTHAIQVEVPAQDAGDDGAGGDGDDSAAPTETLGEFYAQLSAGLASGDGGFALDRLDPHVLDVYPTECPAALARFADPELTIEFVAEGATGPWVWDVQDRSIEIADAVEVEIVLTGRGQSGEPSTAHLTLIDGRYHWFTFCGTA